MQRPGHVVLLLAASGCLASVQAAQSSYDVAVAKLAKDLCTALPSRTDARPNVLAVSWFVLGKTKYTGRFGSLLSTKVRAALLRTGKVKVVTLDLEALDKAKQFWITDFVNPKTVPKTPKGFTAFTLLVRGQYDTDIAGDTVELSAELIDVATSRILGAPNASMRKADAPVRLDAKELGIANGLTTYLAQTTLAVTEPIRPQPGTTRPVARPVRVRVWAEAFRKEFTEGERPRFKATTDRDAYLYLFNIRPDGAAKMIFPNACHRRNFVRAGQVLTIPGDAMKFEFEVTPPFGAEAVQAVATTSRLASVAVATRGLDSPKSVDTPFRDIQGGTKTIADVVRGVRGLTVRRKNEPDPIPAWSEDHWPFTTRKRRDSQ